MTNATHKGHFYMQLSILRMIVNVAILIFCLPALAAQPADSEYRIAPGDTLRVIVFGHEDLSGEFQVDQSGRISLPLIQVIDVSGATKAELESEISGRLSPDYLKNPRVSVEMIEYRPIYVMGEVRNPGSYPYSANMTVVNAIALAGGYTYRAAKKKILLIKANDPKQEKRRSKEQEELAPGDVIEVPERFF